MVKVRGRNSNGKTVKQTVKNGRKSRVTTPRGRHESWCQASAVRGCVPILINPEFDAALDRDSGVTHWMSSPGSALVHWHLILNLFFFFFFFYVVSWVLFDKTVTEYRVWRKVHGTAEEVRCYPQTPGWEISANEATQTRWIAVRCSSATSKTGNRFGWSFFFAVWRRCARSQLHMNSVVLVESQGSCALVRIARLQKFDRRDNMIFTVHLNRLIDENTPLEQSTIETCLQEAYKYQKVTKISCDIWSTSKHRDWTASRWWARWRSQSSSCQHHVITWRGLIPADHEYLDSVAWPCHDCEVAPVWHHDVTNPRTCQFSAVCLTVFPFEFRPRTFTIGFYGKNSIISELMILECSFPLKSRTCQPEVKNVNSEKKKNTSESMSKARQLTHLSSVLDICFVSTQAPRWWYIVLPKYQNQVPKPSSHYMTGFISHRLHKCKRLLLSSTQQYRIKMTSAYAYFCWKPWPQQHQNQ